MDFERIAWVFTGLRDRIRELESKLQTTEVTLDFDKHERSERNEKMNALMRQVWLRAENE